MNVDGYYVRSIEASDVEYIVLELQENTNEGEAGEIIKLKPKKATVTAKMPIPTILETKITHRTNRQRQ